MASRPDLLDRAIIITLPRIKEDERRPESEVWEDFDRCRPAVFGALLSAVSAALRELPHTELEKLPRMADFALWATAAEGGFGWEPGIFLRAYTGNREEAIDVALETDPVAGAVLKFMEDKDEWIGSATDLWKALGKEVDEQVKQTKAWPSAPHTLAGRLNRLAPAMRGKGIEYLETREGRSGSRVKKLRWIPEKDRQKRQRRQPGEKDPQNVRFDADAPADTSQDADASAFHVDTLNNGKRQQEGPANGHVRADTDASDASLRKAEGEENGSFENGERLSGFFEEPPGWFLTQGRLCAQQGAPERLLHPLANAVSTEVFGSPWRWREVLPFVEKRLEDLR